MFFFFLSSDQLPATDSRVEKLERLFSAVRNEAPDISVSTFTSFLAVTRRAHAIADAKLTMNDVAKETGIPYNRFMRHLDVLSDGANGNVGLHLLDRVIDPSNKKRRKFKPSEAGYKLIKNILHELEVPEDS